MVDRIIKPASFSPDTLVQVLARDIEVETIGYFLMKKCFFFRTNHSWNVTRDLRFRVRPPFTKISKNYVYTYNVRAPFVLGYEELRPRAAGMT